ncbi:hypothetical protein [uncultured Kordia sp.]|uniref:hypothetical protein n=1 Tax=uncultured Kordia sp. TaxID=507699 RepID=UPI0026160D5A|nr:hypothetical protein [uncultured Kordia sp.]
MKKKKFRKLTLNRAAISSLSHVSGGVGAGDSVLNQLSGCVGDPVCQAHPPKELSIWSCENQCWTWFTCP